MSTARTAFYGPADHDLAPVAAEAIQVSPLVVGATDVASIADQSLDAIAIRAPAGVVERLAQMLDGDHATAPASAVPSAWAAHSRACRAAGCPIRAAATSAAPSARPSSRAARSNARPEACVSSQP